MTDIQKTAALIEGPHTPSSHSSDPGTLQRGPVKGEPVENRYVDICEVITERINRGRGARRNLPDWGRIVVDRNPRFLCVYRRPTGRDELYMTSLVTGEACYLNAPASRKLRHSVASLVRTVADRATQLFGAFLIVEIWSREPEEKNEQAGDERPAAPRFRLLAPRDPALRSTVEAFERSLGKISIAHRKANVTRADVPSPHPTGIGSLLSTSALESMHTHLIGLEVQTDFLDPATGEPFPLMFRSLRRQLSRALKRGAFEFARQRSTRTPPHYQSLGKRAVAKAVWEVDEQLAELDGSFDLLLSVTPVNRDQAWSRFRKDRYERAPEFFYRPIPVDPDILKRRLFRVPIERVEDPVLADLFRAKQMELDRKLSLLRDRSTPAFLYGSLQLYGAPSNDLIRTAEAILKKTSERDSGGYGGDRVRAKEFCERVKAELAKYRLEHVDMPARVAIREDIDGLIVSRDTLLIGRKLDIPANRVDALIQHEVGTHIVTYLNGRRQPLKLMRTGLPWYDELQEGLGVLAEYIAGGLNAARLRLLAARVVAAAAVTDNAAFIDTFRVLHDHHGVSKTRAFGIATRVHRGGGFVKDMVYLRGIERLLGHLVGGLDTDNLFLGKLNFEHLALVGELRSRGVLEALAVRPLYLDDPAGRERLGRLEERKTTILELMELTKGAK